MAIPKPRATGRPRWPRPRRSLGVPSSLCQFAVESVENGFGCRHDRIASSYYGTTHQVVTVLAYLSQGDLDRAEFRGCDRPQVQGEPGGQVLQGPQGRFADQPGTMHWIAISLSPARVTIVDCREGHLDDRHGAKEMLIDR